MNVVGATPIEENLVDSEREEKLRRIILSGRIFSFYGDLTINL